MKTYISMLRGINVTGKNMIKMAALKEALTKAGLQNFQTYIQSGNIIIKDSDMDSKELETLIKSTIAENFNLDISVINRDLEEWNKVIDHNPFIKLQDVDLARLHVTFLSAEADKAKLEAIKDFKHENDQFLITDNTVYLYTPGGYGNTKLSNTFFENKLKQVATTRNWKTVNELKRLAELE